MRGDWEKHSIFPCSLGYPRVLGFIYIGSSHAELQNQESGLEIDSSIGAWIHLMLKYFFFFLILCVLWIQRIYSIFYSCIVVSLTQMSFFSHLCFSVPDDFVTQLKSAQFLR